MLHAAIALCLLLQADDKAKDEEAKKKVSEFQKAVGKAKMEDKPGLIKDLSDLKHSRVLDELIKWLTKGDKDCQEAAAKAVAEYEKDKTAAEGLLKAARAHKDPGMVETMLDRIGDVRYKGVVKDLVSFFRQQNLDVCKAAIDAVGSLKTKDGIGPLLDLGRELDAIRDDDTGTGKSPGGPGPGGPGPGGPGPGGPGPGGPGGNQPGKDSDKQERKKQLLPAVIGSLKDITGKKFEKVKEWSDWWAKNKEKFKDLDDK